MYLQSSPAKAREEGAAVYLQHKGEHPPGFPGNAGRIFCARRSAPFLCFLPTWAGRPPANNKLCNKTTKSMQSSNKVIISEATIIAWGTPTAGCQIWATTTLHSSFLCQLQSDGIRTETNVRFLLLRRVRNRAPPAKFVIMNEHFNNGGVLLHSFLNRSIVSGG